MNESDVTDWLYNECRSLLSSSSVVSVSIVNDHVGLTEDRYSPDHYPFIGIRQVSTSKQTAGLGNGDLHVHDVTYVDGVVESITYKKEPTLRVELVPVSDGDKLVRDDLADELADHFSLLERTNQYPDDIGELAVEEPTPENRSEEFVYADGVPVEVEYTRRIEHSDVTAVESVNVDVDVSDTPDDVSDDVDAFDRSV